MNPEQILEQLSVRGRVPTEAIRAADADRAAVLPSFLQAIEQCCRGEAAPATKAAMLVVFHLLGEWRDTRAYRPLATLLRLPSDELEVLLGDAITETNVRVMAGVFDGDPTPLYDVILDPEADEFARSAMCEALALVTLRGALPREEAARFLLACNSDLKPRSECFVWQGWQGAIAMLGLVELKSLVENAFRRGTVSSTWLELRHFEADLAQTIRDPQSWLAQPRYAFLTDTIEELSRWSAFREEYKQATADDDWTEDLSTDWSPSPWPPAPLVNPFKGVGRNDPCPCGSGQKFKKCCLSLTQEAYADV
ncbi:MAG: DUF1186 domain-containing protein [Xanthobacteraceae bacterium]